MVNRGEQILYDNAKARAAEAQELCEALRTISISVMTRWRTLRQENPDQRMDDLMAKLRRQVERV